jgi:subtilisin family serine protease
MRKTLSVFAVTAMAAAVWFPVGGAAASNRPAESYVVVMTSGDPGLVAASHTRRYGGEVRHVYRHALRGYAAMMSATAASNVSRDPRVDYVVPDGLALPHELTRQQNPTWGLDRIDQRLLPLDSSYSYEGDGAGVNVYVIDSGIRADHQEFDGRVTGGHTWVDDGYGTGDCNGHGTHVAGTIGGSVWGVAKAVTLVPLRVFGCSGGAQWSTVIAAVDWVTKNATAPGVVNMSLGGGGYQPLDDAVRSSIAKGHTYAVSAGNDNADACRYSPARVAEALTVGATDASDNRASFSNRGSCLDLFAPGVSITSAWSTGTTATHTISGTSMSAPHVAGVAALYLQANEAATATAVHDAVVSNGTPGVVGRSGPRSPNLLVHSLFGTTSVDDPEDTDDPEDPGDPVEPPEEPIDQPSEGLRLVAEGQKVRGLQQVRLTWSGGTTGAVEVQRDGVVLQIEDAGNEGEFLDELNARGAGSYTYTACEVYSDGAVPECDEQTVTF